MCKENREYFIILLVGLLLASVVGVLRGEERESWYLIADSELSIIEQYRATSEAEKRSWLLQAQVLRRDSEILNSQLAQAREANRKLERSSSVLEAEWLTRLSLKNGEIAALNQALAEKTLEAEKHKGVSRSRLVVILALAGTWIVFIAFKVRRFFRLI
jgi:hypothetical protein